jgi:hypothetical protein
VITFAPSLKVAAILFENLLHLPAKGVSHRRDSVRMGRCLYAALRNDIDHDVVAILRIV